MRLIAAGPVAVGVLAALVVVWHRSVAAEARRIDSATPIAGCACPGADNRGFLGRELSSIAEVASPSRRVPVVGQQRVYDDACASLEDGLARVREQLEASRERVEDLSAEVASLQFENERLLHHDGRDTWSHFLRLPDAELISDPEERRFLKGYLEDRETGLPFYLQAGEALWLVERERADDWNDWGGGVLPAAIQFLGPERVLREAPPEWIEWRKEFYDEEQWLELFGTPLPE